MSDFHAVKPIDVSPASFSVLIEALSWACMTSDLAPEDVY